MARARIDAALEEAILDASLVLVSAPAGSGKSVAISGWLARRGGGGAWYSLDPEDNDPAVFWPSVAAALGLPGATKGVDARWIARALFAESPGESPGRPGGQPGSGPRVLVLDDYHFVTNPEVHAGVDRLLVEAPAELRLVISTRHDPPLTLSRLRAHGALRELRYEDLRLDPDETAAVVSAVTGTDLPAPDLDLLVERTDGWAAAVQLVGLSGRVRGRPEALLESLAGDNRHVFDYFRDEVIAQLPDDLRRFLLATAILDRLTAPLCEAVTGEPGAQLMLEELERRNLFVVPLDDRRRWFRYHHLFAEWLRLHAGDDPAAHRAAAGWLLANDHTADAVRHLIAAGDVEEAAGVIDSQRWWLVGTGRARTLQDWLEMLPAEIRRRRPDLTLAAAWAAYVTGRWDDVRALTATVDPTDPMVRAELLVLEAGRHLATGDPKQALQLAREGLPLVPAGDPRARTALLLAEGRALLETGALDGAARSFDEAFALAEPFGVSIVMLLARSHLAEVHRRAGRLAEAEASARWALDLAEAEGLAHHIEAAAAHVTLAETLIDQGRPSEAALNLQRAGELAERDGYRPVAPRVEAVRRRLDETGGAGGRRPTSPDLVEQLTGRELSVLRLLPSPATPREIAAELYLSINTIKTHMRSLYRKLGVNSRHEAIEAARRMNLL